MNVGAGKRTSLNGLVDALRSVTGVDLNVRHQPQRPGDVRDSLASLERSSRLIGYAPTVDLDEGLRATWEWASGALVSLAASDTVSASA